MLKGTRIFCIDQHPIELCQLAGGQAITLASIEIAWQPIITDIPSLYSNLSLSGIPYTWYSQMVDTHSDLVQV